MPQQRRQPNRSSDNTALRMFAGRLQMLFGQLDWSQLAGLLNGGEYLRRIGERLS